MKIDDGFGDLDDDVELPTEADIANEVSGDATEDMTMNHHELFQTVICRNLQNSGSGWDGADLAWLRTQLEACRKRREKTIAVDCRNVLVMKEGTFSVFQQMAEAGIAIYLLNPTQKVQDWYWFQMFAEKCGEGVFRLHATAQRDYVGIARSGIFRAPEEDE